MKSLSSLDCVCGGGGVISSAEIKAVLGAISARVARESIPRKTSLGRPNLTKNRKEAGRAMSISATEHPGQRGE